MEPIVSLQDVANIVTLIAPGYFALRVYSLAYIEREEREFPRLLIESVVYSLPIVTIVNIMWLYIFRQESTSSLNVGYVSLIILIAFITGLIASFMRTKWPVKQIATKLGLDPPDEDFVKLQLLRVDVTNRNKSAITVQLKSGAVFSGTIDRLSRYNSNGPNYYYFANLAWFNEDTNEWDEREGGIIIERSEIEYIETPKLAR